MATLEEHKNTYGCEVFEIERGPKLSIYSVWTLHFATFGTPFDILDNIFGTPDVNATI
jgi:hypothetical protein